MKIGQKSELFCGSPLDYVTAANAAAATTTRFAPQQTLLHYLCCLKTVVCVRVCVCVSVSRRVAKPIDVLRVTSCGPLSRRLMQPQRSATQGATATKTAPIYHFPGTGTGTVNTGRRVQRQRRLLDSATLFLSLSLHHLLSSIADDKWLPELASRLTCVRKSSGQCNNKLLVVVVAVVVVRVFYGRVMQCATVR